MRVCNKCGKPLDFWDISADISWNRYMYYGSKYDGDMMDLHLCSDCLDELIDSCQLTPIVSTEDDSAE